uniref:Uncharacterized protein n=1 Tax=Globodera rostochiensis TaxID=31243 RepID=A0A914HWA1_GLORO
MRLTSCHSKTVSLAKARTPQALYGVAIWTRSVDGQSGLSKVAQIANLHEYATGGRASFGAILCRRACEAHILLDLNTLAQLAIYEPTSFQCLVDLAQKMALVDGEAVVQSPEELAHVQCDGSLFGQPFPEAKLYPEGPTENHLEVPRQLTLDEY